jgi:predicted lipase
MIPFDGKFAQHIALPLAVAAYDSTQPPAGFVLNQTAFEILANAQDNDFKAQSARSDASHQRMMQSMLRQPRQHQGATAGTAVRSLQASAPNLHFGWVCIDTQTVTVAIRGTELIHEWFDNFDFIPAPYGPVPGRGTVHQGFQLVYYSIRASLVALVRKFAAGRKNLLLTGHSLGGALCALAAVDLMNDAARDLSPVVYTWAEPRVGHDDFVILYDTHINVCYRIVNVWDVVPHLPPDIADYEHEGEELVIDSGFSFDVVHNHVLATGYTPGITKWNQQHP